MSRESEQKHIEPSSFVKAFCLIGAFIAVSAVAAMVTYVMVSADKRWRPYEYCIFGVAWGICARLFDLSVRRGIKTVFASGSLTDERRKTLGEQLAMLRMARKFVHVELIGSAVLLVIEVLRR